MHPLRVGLDVLPAVLSGAGGLVEVIPVLGIARVVAAGDEVLAGIPPAHDRVVMHPLRVGLDVLPAVQPCAGNIIEVIPVLSTIVIGRFRCQILLTVFHGTRSSIVIHPFLIVGNPLPAVCKQACCGIKIEPVTIDALLAPNGLAVFVIHRARVGNVPAIDGR